MGFTPYLDCNCACFDISVCKNKNYGLCEKLNTKLQNTVRWRFSTGFKKKKSENLEIFKNRAFIIQLKNVGFSTKYWTSLILAHSDRFAQSTQIYFSICHIKRNLPFNIRFFENIRFSIINRKKRKKRNAFFFLNRNAFQNTIFWKFLLIKEGM